MQIQAKKVNFNQLPSSHLVLLIDVSGSMDMPNRLPLLKTSFRMLVNNLRDCDTLSIITYGGAVSVVLRPTAGNEKEKILKAQSTRRLSQDRDFQQHMEEIQRYESLKLTREYQEYQYLYNLGTKVDMYI
jgi:secreted protein with Ig-like and vWFA domain